jgi:membrane protease YdiL (CAAX protease family)
LPTAEPIRTREVGWPVVTLFLVVTFGVLTLFPLARRAGPMARVILPGWLENLVPFGILLLIGVGGVLVGFGRVRMADLGLARPAFVRGAVTILVVWSVNQGIAAASALATTGRVPLDGRWDIPGVGPTLLWASVMFFGTALFEEIAFRGFLYPQLVLKLRRAGRTGGWAAAAAGLVSQLFFAASHLPSHLIIRHWAGGVLWTQLLLQGIAGILLLLIYLRTRSLWIAVGLHGLADAPTALVPGTLSWEIPSLILLVGWPWLARRPEHRGLASVEGTGGHERHGATGTQCASHAPATSS